MLQLCRFLNKKTSNMREIILIIMVVLSTVMTPLHSEAQCLPSPTNFQIIDTTCTDIVLSWDLNPNANHYRIRYQAIGASTWEVLNVGKVGVYTLNFAEHGLVTGTEYKFCVRVFCTTSTSGGTSPQIPVILPPCVTDQRPNILFIVVDDSRADWYSCNGAASFFQTPNIDRIANEGVNFNKSFVELSLCAPTRATMLTGRSAHVTGVRDNSTQDSLNRSLPFLPRILRDSGYYTAHIGKNHDLLHYSDNCYNYWLELISNDGVVKKNANINNDGPYKKITGYTSDFLTDTAMKVIKANTGKPFFVWLSYKAPHTPYISAPQFDDYRSFPLELEGDTAKFENEYPSFFDELPPGNNYSFGSELEESYYLTYSMIAQLDSNIGRLLSALTESGKLENTLIIFTSDNGYMYGEHHLSMKRIAYEPSINIPLFVRFPLWFSGNNIVSNKIALNIDFAPTILDAAGIDASTFGMEGLSLHELYDGAVSRTEFLYRTYYTTEGNYDKLPYVYALRDTSYKFIQYGCNETTEEFFDLSANPMEMNNLINNASYETIIATYRNKLEQAIEISGDTSEDTQINCFLVNNPPRIGEFYSGDEESEELFVYPNPGNNTIILNGTKNIEHVDIFDMLGTHMQRTYLKEIDVQALPSGTYILVLYTVSGIEQALFIKQ